MAFVVILNCWVYKGRPRSHNGGDALETRGDALETHADVPLRREIQELPGDVTAQAHARREVPE